MMILNFLGTILGMSNNNNGGAATSVASTVTSTLNSLQLPPAVSAGVGAAAGAAAAFTFLQPAGSSATGAALGALASGALANLTLPTDPKKLAGQALFAGVTSGVTYALRNPSTNADEETKAQLAIAERNKQEAERVAAETRALNHRIWLYERKVTPT